MTCASEKTNPLPLNTDDEVEIVAKLAGWDNRRYMTPADYAIWCERMREFVRLVKVAPPSGPQMEKAKFIDTYVATFLAAHTANIYDEACAYGLHNRFDNQPIEDAVGIAESAWEQLKRNR